MAPDPLDELAGEMIDDVALVASIGDPEALGETVTRLSNRLSGMTKWHLVRLTMLLVAKAAGYRDAAVRGPLGPGDR